MKLQLNFCRMLLGAVPYFHRNLKTGEILSIYHSGVYCIIEIHLTRVSIIIYPVLAPQPEQLLIKTCSHQRLYKKHTRKEVCTTFLFQKLAISFHPNIALETKLNWHTIDLIYPRHNAVIFNTSFL